jgi:hypothetical protein
MATIDLATGYTEKVSQKTWHSKHQLKFFSRSILEMDGL